MEQFDRNLTDALLKLHKARHLARRLREEKSDHPWTNEECGLLAELCKVLEVDGEGP